MVRITGIKWEKAVTVVPVHNIISSDFPKYCPHPWKFEDGNPRVEWLLSYEYQRMWLAERDAWRRRMFPEHQTAGDDVVKRYVATFKQHHAPPAQAKKKPFRMKKFENIPSKTTTKRPANDKALRRPHDKSAAATAKQQNDNENKP